MNKTLKGLSLTEQEREDVTIEHALIILKKRLKIDGLRLNDHSTTAKYLKLKLAVLEHEVFGLLFLDFGFKLIHDEILFRGTVNHSTVYPREVVKEAVKHNAVNVVIYHNHPSGNSSPSPSDTKVTDDLKKALAVIDVNLVDHIIIAGDTHYSYATEKKL
jgi:DNA repair protein RadC